MHCSQWKANSLLKPTTRTSGLVLYFLTLISLLQPNLFYILLAMYETQETYIFLLPDIEKHGRNGTVLHLMPLDLVVLVCICCMAGTCGRP